MTSSNNIYLYTILSCIGVILLVIAGFLFWKEKESFQIILAIGITLFIAGIVKPNILKPVYWMWMVFATILGWVMTRVILSLLFFLMFTPIGLISRLFGKQFLGLKWKPFHQAVAEWRDHSATSPKTIRFQWKWLS